MHDDSETLYQRLMNGEIAFNTDEYGALVNSIEIEKCADPIEKLLAMSVSNNHTVTMALAFILRESISRACPEFCVSTCSIYPVKEH